MVTIFLVVLLDQLSKYAVVSLLAVGGSHPIFPGFFNIVLTYNRGVAFGLFSGIESDVTRYLVLGLTTIVALGAVTYFIRHDSCRGILAKLSLSMILGGALGNIIDRVRLGMVVDFLDVFWGEHHWPAFNVADSCITIGVLLLLFATPSEDKKAKKEEPCA